MTDASLLWKLIALAAIIGNLIILGRKLFGKIDSRLIANSPLLIQEQQEWITRREHASNHSAFEARIATLEHRFDLSHAGFKKDLAELRETSARNHSEIMRAIGRLEGK